ncbi:MAG: hemolysin D [Spirochaetae bacterium HGW-Spirochaetae-7]|jgi:hemolysin III|nr:MAG: hemolysin D [Spirochaetae bacterium HGW-Spirochaetae-7]
MDSTGRTHRFRERQVLSRVQETGNAATHGIGAMLAIAGLVILVVKAVSSDDVWYVVSYSIFGSSMVLLYLASASYHAVREPRLKRKLEVLDHSAVFILIAGSYTAFALTILRDSVGWWLFGAVWTITLIGIVIEAMYLNRWPFITLLVYLAMGWLIVLAWKPLAAAGSPAMIAWLFAGGASYTVGTIFYALGRRWGWLHIGWHLFVIGGTVCHFFSALRALPVA